MTTTEKPCVLIVEDDPFIRKMLRDHLAAEGYVAESAEDGAEAWSLLEQDPDRYAAVLLDRTMPNMDGMQLLERIKSHEPLQGIPVVLQTSLDAPEEILEGLEAGAYYYLTKPVERRTLLAIVRSAVSDHDRYRLLRREVRSLTGSFSLMTRGVWEFRSLDDGKAVATLLARCCADSERVVTGLSELIINAVEHGNLAITYDEKSRLMEDGTWRAEIDRRLALPEYRDRRVRVDMDRTGSEVRFTIRDEGEGFDWRNYLEFSPDRAFDTHGRGIAMSRHMSFDRLEYVGRGNEVRATVRDEADRAAAGAAAS